MATKSLQSLAKKMPWMRWTNRCPLQFLQLKDFMKPSNALRKNQMSCNSLITLKTTKLMELDLISAMLSKSWSKEALVKSLTCSVRCCARRSRSTESALKMLLMARGSANSQNQSMFSLRQNGQRLLGQKLRHLALQSLALANASKLTPLFSDPSTQRKTQSQLPAQ